MSQEQLPPEEQAANMRLLMAEQVLQAVEAWRAKYKPRSAESCYQMDNCVINAPELVEECMTIAGYYKDADDE